MRRILLTALIALCTPLAWAGPQLGVGAADQIDGRAAGLVTVGWLTDQPHPWEFMGGYIAARRSTHTRPVPDALFLALSRRLQFRHWFASVGLAHVDEDNEVLSGHYQFMTGAGYAGEGWSLSLRHLSNAGTNGRNRGETFLLFQLDLDTQPD